jgi:hypothetical protein
MRRARARQSARRPRATGAIAASCSLGSANGVRLVQGFDDSDILPTVNEIKDLSSGMSAQFGQRITILDRLPSRTVAGEGSREPLRIQVTCTGVRARARQNPSSRSRRRRRSPGAAVSWALFVAKRPARRKHRSDARTEEPQMPDRANRSRPEGTARQRSGAGARVPRTRAPPMQRVHPRVGAMPALTSH